MKRNGYRRRRTKEAGQKHLKVAEEEMQAPTKTHAHTKRGWLKKVRRNSKKK